MLELDSLEQEFGNNGLNPIIFGKSVIFKRCKICNNEFIANNYTGGGSNKLTCGKKCSQSLKNLNQRKRNYFRK